MQNNCWQICTQNQNVHYISYIAYSTLHCLKYLKNCLETESEAVPKSKLSTWGTGDQSSAFRGPLQSATSTMCN